MRPKILTVDDSKTVRMIVRKTFKIYDCEILEASNGVEGLAAATKSQPSIILLDVTMPVMDGVEMLTRLKSDPKTKEIPVVMLTAEGGRDNIVNIAKLGVRGYIVKPFREELMIEKVGGIIELKPAEVAPAKIRTLLDPLEILVVDDKPAIVQLIEQGLKHHPWRITGAATQLEAIEVCGGSTPDAIVVSLSLPDDAGVKLYRLLRNNPKTKYTPIFALVVKTDASALGQAQQLGFTAVITKPIDLAELEGRICKALNLDTSAQYFRTDAEVLVISLPESATAAALADVSQYLGGKLAGAVDAGIGRVVIDLHAVRSLHIGIIRLLVQAMQASRDLAMQVAVVGNAALAAECRGFEETRNWTFHDSLAEAKAHLGAPAVAAVAG
jgi:two-component system cell cycle response regulator